MIARTCTHCGGRIEPGETCRRCAATKRPRICLSCRRYALPGTQHCEEHQPDRMVDQPWRKSYSTATYRKNRKVRYVQADGRCETCGIPVGDGQWECDHELPLSDGGTDDVVNLRVKCIVPRFGAPRGCHGVKSKSDRRKRR